MRRALVSVATEPYHILQDRQIQWFGEVDPGCLTRLWREIPKSWPSHEQRPYAFKSRALVAAAETIDLLLWCDAAVVPIRSMAPLWKRIEQDGYWVMNNGWKNDAWTATEAYEILFPGMPLAKARQANKEIPHVCAAAFGVNVKHPIGQMLLSDYFRLCDTEAIRGPWKNTPDTRCGPPGVLGHRHDQTILSIVAHDLGCKLTSCPDVFAYAPHETEASIIVSDGAMTLKRPFTIANQVTLARSS